MGAFLRKYGVATAAGTHVRIPVVKAGVVDFAVSADWTPAAGDVKVSKDGGAQANVGTLPTFTNGAWQFVFTAAELTAKTAEVVVVDAVTKAVEDQMFIVETYGNASALHPFDFGDATPTVDVSQWLGAAPNALASGRVDVSVGAMAANVLNAAAIAVNAITSSKIATDAIGAAQFAQGAADKAWSSATRTLTAFSTSLAVSVWDVLETAIMTASSIGLKVKNNLDAAVSSRSSHGDPDPNGFMDAAVSSRATPAQVNTEVDNALNTAVPGSPTTDSINERVKAIDDKLPSGSIGDATSANQTTILNRLGDFGGTGLNTVKGFLQALFRKDAGVSGVNLPAEINEVENATAGAYDATTDSQEALRDTAPLGTAMRGTDSAALAADYTSGRATKLDNLDEAVSAAKTLTAAERNSVADALLKRDWTAVTGEAARSVLNALRFLRNKWSLSGTTLTVKKEDDTANAWTSIVVTDASADPVTESDPA